MADDPAKMRRHYGELALRLLLIDSLEADELGITVEELDDRRNAAYKLSKYPPEPRSPYTGTP